MPRRGADLVVDALVQAGVRYVFSVSGNHILSIYDAAIDRGLTLVHARHEAAAVHMADAWGRLTGEPGVALVTAGPGHANALSALYGAVMSESPMVLLSGHAPRGELGLGSFQEMDQVAAAQPVAKAAWMVETTSQLGVEIGVALGEAGRVRPGPIALSLPGDVLEAKVDADAVPRPEQTARRPIRDARGLREVLARLAAARRPLLLCGPAMGRGPRWQAVRALAEATGAPALVIESPRGVNDPSLHFAPACFADADLVVLVGKPLDFSLRFGEPPAFGPACAFVALGRWGPTVVRSRTIEPALDVDPWTAVTQMTELAREITWTKSTWANEVADARRATPPEWRELARSTRTPVHPLAVCAALQPLVDAGAVLVSDGGEFGQWAQAGLTAPVRLINGPSGSIGSAIPMAIAARLARADATVIATLGDGTFGFHALELDTAVRHDAPIVAVVGNDARWNAEHQLQLRHYGPSRTTGCDLLPSRYDRVAEALGGHGELVERAVDLKAAIARAVASGLPACVNVMIDGVPAPTFGARRMS